MSCTFFADLLIYTYVYTFFFWHLLVLGIFPAEAHGSTKAKQHARHVHVPAPALCIISARHGALLPHFCACWKLLRI